MPPAVKTVIITVLKQIKNFFFLIIAFLCCLLIFAYSYIILFPYLNNEGFSGTDSPNAYTYSEYVNKYFPSIPFWYPNQAGGASFSAGYPWLSHYMVVIVHRLAHIPLIHAFNLLPFLSFTITGMGIFIYCWTRLPYPRQNILKMSIGLIAAFFYLSAPVTYIFGYHWGFYAESVSYMFSIFALIFADWLLTLSFNGVTNYKVRLATAGLAITWSLTFLTHFATAVGLLGIVSLLFLARSLYAVIKLRKLSFKRIIIAGLLTFLPLILLIGWRYLPYSDYTKQVALGGFDGQNVDGFANSSMNPKLFMTYEHILGLKDFSLPDARTSMNSFKVQVYVWILALVTVLLGWIRIKKFIPFSLLITYGFFNYTSPEFIAALNNLHLPFLLQLPLNLRSTWSMVKLVLPIMAAYGTYCLWDLFLFIIDYLTKKIGKVIDLPWQEVIRPAITLTLLLITAYFMTFQVERYIKSDIKEPPFTQLAGLRMVNYKDPWLNLDPASKRTTYPIFELNRWPRPQLSSDPVIAPAEIVKFFSAVPDNPMFTRFDIPATVGSAIMYAPLITQSSYTHSYIGQINLWSTLKNYQSYVMYTTLSQYKGANLLSELAKYIGYQYIFIGVPSAPLERYQSDRNWQPVPEHEGWWKFTQPTGLLSWTNKPSVLVIGEEKSFIYDMVFRIANNGMLSYDDAILFNKGENIEDYNIEELGKFNAIFLQAYKYKDQKKAHDLIGKYLENGGNVFVETGWQYKNSDWQMEETPSYFPLSRLDWKNTSVHSSMVIDNSDAINENSSEKNIGLLSIDNSPWGISSSSYVRNDSKVILQNDGMPLLSIRKVGKGRIVHSGFNAVAHLEANVKGNSKESEVLHNALLWLLNGTSQSPSYSDKKVEIYRPNPDLVAFNFRESTDKYTTLYWRESYYPMWHAVLKRNGATQEIPVYRAGPRLMGMRIPPVNENDKLVLEIKTPIIYQIAKAVAITALIFLLLSVLGLTRPVEKLSFNIKSREKQESEPEE